MNILRNEIMWGSISLISQDFADNNFIQIKQMSLKFTEM